VAPLLIMLVQAAVVAAPGCTLEEERALAVAERLVSRGDDALARDALEQGRNRTGPPCATLVLARVALTGWIEARCLAPTGGAPDLLGPVQRWLDELASLDRRREDPPAAPGAAEVLRIEIEYAETAIRAAIAAAQDERPEMELRLTHARDLTERLARRGARPRWPRTFNLLAGELWLEVDRYADALDAFERAVSAEPSARGLVGLARAQAQLGRTGEACETYARVRDAAPALKARIEKELARCR
jgi:tetratricopeptide (TPR) repeat protein